MTAANPPLVQPVVWSWPRALLVTAVTIWLPSLLPFAVGPLTECAHCVRTYLRLLPVLPGVLPSLQLRMQDAAFVACAAAVTLGLVACVTWLARTAYYKAFVLIVTACLAGAHALFLGALLRR